VRGTKFVTISKK